MEIVIESPELGDIALYCAQELGIDAYNVIININECCLKHDNAMGWCYDVMEDEIDIEIEKTLSLKKKMITLCHEMVHAWQACKGDETFCEEQANKLEGRLYDGFLHSTNR